jgi:O-antigen ligase
LLFNFEKKKGLLALFLFISAVIIALVSSTFFSHVLLFSALTLLIITISLFQFDQFKWTALSLAVLFFIANVLISIFIYSPVYSPTALYYISFFICGFIIFSIIDNGLTIKIFKAVICIYVILSCWALVQHFTASFYIQGAAPNTIFTTKNTFAAALNLILLPVMVFYCYRETSKSLYLATIILFCGLLVTISRGGYISFLAGFIIISILVFLSQGILNKAKWKKIVLGLLIAIILINFNGTQFIVNSSIELMNYLNQSNQSNQSNIEYTMPVFTYKGEQLASSRNAYARLFYYEIALKQIRDNPLSGYGYLNYKYYFHRDKSEKLYGKQRYGGFTHNDYLQLWVETGVLGLLSLLIIMLLLFKRCYSMIRDYSQPDDTQFIAIAIGSALLAYFTHAMVDFVMYPPILLLSFGAYLGIANRLLFNQVDKLSFSTNLLKINDYISPNLIKIMTCGLCIIYLFQPAYAELLWKDGIRKSNLQQYDKALGLYERAIKFAPYDAEYYFRAGQIYYTSAERSGNKEHAIAADKLFSQGAEQNPFDYHNLYARIKLHRDHPELFDKAATKQQILDWFEYILAWQPQHEFIMSEYIKTLVLYNEYEQAIKELDNSLKYHPESSRLLDIKEKIINLSRVKDRDK